MYFFPLVYRDENRFCILLLYWMDNGFCFIKKLIYIYMYIKVFILFWYNKLILKKGQQLSIFWSIFFLIQVHVRTMTVFAQELKCYKFWTKSISICIFIFNAFFMNMYIVNRWKVTGIFKVDKCNQIEMNSRISFLRYVII